MVNGPVSSLLSRSWIGARVVSGERQKDVGNDGGGKARAGRGRNGRAGCGHGGRVTCCHLPQYFSAGPPSPKPFPSSSFCLHHLHKPWREYSISSNDHCQSYSSSTRRAYSQRCALGLTSSRRAEPHIETRLPTSTGGASFPHSSARCFRGKARTSYCGQARLFEICAV